MLSEKLQAEFAVRGEAHGSNKLKHIEHLKIPTSLNHMFTLLRKEI